MEGVQGADHSFSDASQEGIAEVLPEAAWQRQLPDDCLQAALLRYPELPDFFKSINQAATHIVRVFPNSRQLGTNINMRAQTRADEAAA